MNKNARLILQFSGSLLCLVLLVIVLQSLTADVPRHYAHGERLRLSNMTSREMVVVQESGGDRGPRLMHEYRIERTDRGFQSVAMRGYVEWRDGKPTFVHEGDAVVRTRPELQVLGLEDMLSYFGEQPEESSSANQTTHVRYFRSGDEVGEELFVGYHLDGDLAYRRGESRGDDYPLSEVYRDLATRYGIPPSRLARMMAFTELLKDPKAARRASAETK